MPSRYGQQAAAGAASGLGNLVDLTMRLYENYRQDERFAAQNAQAEAARKMANDLALKKIEADAERNKPNPGLEAFSDWLSSNPNASLDERNLAAMRLGVSGTPDVKNFLGTSGKAADIGYRADEASARQNRFSETMKYRKSKDEDDLEFATRKWKESLELATRAQDEKEAENRREDARAWAAIAARKQNSLMSFANRGGFSIDNDDELLAAAREVEDNKKLLSQMQAEQSIALPDPMKKSEYDALLKNTSALEKAIQVYVIKGKGVEPVGTGTVLKSSTTTPLGLTPPESSAPKKQKTIKITPVSPPASTNQNSEAESLISIMNQQRNR